ncbi:hypothetical protein [Chryseobacterium sp. MP_3.2]|uniref:hypothetical protein n=1 Tax=Chryseobacterium sp. MP_3.2 TaxID=3071712 RepID=UPI002DF83C5E|nr:hypothetical protein [Chryseobacterium sp. MP_3.2]
MKKQHLNILTISAIMTTIGFIMDGDPKVPSVLLRFTEFFLMLGIVFLITSALYFGISKIARKFQKI